MLSASFSAVSQGGGGRKVFLGAPGGQIVWGRYNVLSGGKAHKGRMAQF